MPSYLYSQASGFSKYFIISSAVNMTSASIKLIGTNGSIVAEFNVFFFDNKATFATSPETSIASLTSITSLPNAFAIASSTRPSYDPIRISLDIILTRYFASNGEHLISSPFKMFFLSLLECSPLRLEIFLNWVDISLNVNCPPSPPPLPSNWSKRVTTCFLDTAYSAMAPMSPCSKWILLMSTSLRLEISSRDCNIVLNPMFRLYGDPL